MKLAQLFGVLLLIPALAKGLDLSGEWQGSDGGSYYLVQQGNQLSWYAERSATTPAWAHVFDGQVRGSGIKGRWVDVPKGSTRGHGELVLDIRENGNVLQITRKTGGFGGERLTRAGYTPPAVGMPPAVTARPPAAGMAPVSPMVKEDCISFNYRTATRKQINGHWKIVDGSHWIFDFGDNASEAQTALNIIKRYRMDRSCYVGRPDPSLSYLLAGGNAPSGNMGGEDCLAFNPDNASVVNAGGRWKVVDGSHWLFDFGDNEGEANQALAIIKKYRFSHSCYVGRPDPSFTYMRR